MTLSSRIEAASGPDYCAATFGREGGEHSFVTVTRSSYRDSPYLMCSKCGTILAAAAIKIKESERAD